ncbi:hypothetical protein SLEP1_g19574 [Rubroshorea leprosula]|uniref:Uncharacterized protein n=1 Tax=Rubroshorea leprosula TaxID=152421 RepID=A0AAV5IZU6_9ROSI|nr:hypothetical protein SLEP1_g19574 [Rubroshorea leprosula]
MRREGRQHGMVRTYQILPVPLNPRSEPRFPRRLDSPPTAGLFTKVPAKPTNHSKFTGKCGQSRCLGCHMHPVCKSKDKTKGSHKLRSIDMLANYRMITWRIVDGRPGLNYSGFSATGILDYLANNHLDDDDDNDNDEMDDDDESNHVPQSDSSPENLPMIEEHVKEDEKRGNDGCVIDDDNMGFVDLGFELDQNEVEEGWYLVGEI